MHVAKWRLSGLTNRQLQTVEELQPFRDEIVIGPHLRMLHAICNIDKHRHLNVVSTHYVLRETGYAHQGDVSEVVEVCFIGEELEQASPGYGSRFESVGTVKRPPVVPVLKSCLAAVVEVVERLTGELVDDSVSRKLRRDCV